MKKLFCFFLLTAACCLFACENDDTISDSVYSGTIIWVNASDHRITMTIDGRFCEEKIAPGESLTKEHEVMASSPQLYDYLMWGIIVVFDDGPYGGEFIDRSWVKDEDRILNPGFDFNYQTKGHTWTYTFTNADYEAAVARGPMAE